MPILHSQLLPGMFLFQPLRLLLVFLFKLLLPCGISVLLLHTQVLLILLLLKLRVFLVVLVLKFFLLLRSELAMPMRESDVY